jgi:hypothetical protein
MSVEIKKPDEAALDWRILKVPMPSTIELIPVKNDFGIANAVSRLETWKTGIWSGLQISACGQERFYASLFLSRRRFFWTNFPWLGLS